MKITLHPIFLTLRLRNSHGPSSDILVNPLHVVSVARARGVPRGMPDVTVVTLVGGAVLHVENELKTFMEPQK